MKKLHRTFISTLSGLLASLLLTEVGYSQNLKLASPAPTKPCQGLNEYQAPCITEVEANEIIQNVLNTIAPRFKAEGFRLLGINDWADPSENAGYGMLDKRTVVFRVKGGAIRATETSRDSLVIILCHELGHLVNGLIPGHVAAGGEGEADYFASSICATEVFKAYPSVHPIESQWHIPAQVTEACRSKHKESELQVCERVNRASLAGALLSFRTLQESVVPSFLTPDPTEVSETRRDGTNSQCRLDTFFAGSLQSARPRCWFKP